MANKKEEKNSNIKEKDVIQKGENTKEMPVQKQEEAVQKEELNLDQKVTIKNLAPWDVTFHRISDGGFGDVYIVAHGTYRLSRSEIIAQIQSGNQLFCGFNMSGEHATIYIEDEPTRVEVGFESEEGKDKQRIVNNNTIKEVFDYKTQDAFEKHFAELVKTRSEKFAAMEIIKNLKFNDYNKIRFAEDYTKIRIQK